MQSTNDNKFSVPRFGAAENQAVDGQATPANVAETNLSCAPRSSAAENQAVDGQATPPSAAETNLSCAPRSSAAETNLSCAPRFSAAETQAVDGQATPASATETQAVDGQATLPSAAETQAVDGQATLPVLAAKVTYISTINLSLEQSAINVVPEITLVNKSNDDLENLECVLSSPTDFFEAATIRVERLKAREELPLHDIRLTLNY
ncbi:MAG: hypothetical protein IKR81_09250, partial [Victivallales bacterium]|nr:hypothetical protein [Victivallales bacterium]